MANEVISKRDSHSKHFHLGGNEYRLDAYSYPVHYMKDGQWEDIDINVLGLKEWEFTDGVLSNVFRVYFGDSSSGNTHLFGVEFDNNRWVNFKLKWASPVRCESVGNTHKFFDCFKNVDVEYLVLPEQVKENIILNEPTDIREFVFTIKSGGVAIAEMDGGIVITDEVTGEILWVIDKPYLEDANGELNYGVSYQIGNDGQFDTLTVHVTDEDFLSRAAYPVVIDPTILVSQDDASNQNVVMATELQSTSWSWNSYNTIGAWNNGGTRYDSAIYFKALDSLKTAPNFVINKATFSIFCYQFSPYQSPQQFQGSRISNVSANMALNTVPSSVNDQWYSFIDTNSAPINIWTNIDFKTQLLNKGSNFNGFYFTAPTTGRGNGFYSPFYTGDITKRPMLTVEYVAKPSIVFHDGTGVGNLYGDPQGNVFKYFDFGSMLAGQTSIPKKAYLMNMTGVPVTNVRVKVTNKNIATGASYEISLTDSPFIAEDILVINGTLADNASTSFFVRVVTNETATTGGNFIIKATVTMT